MRRVQTLCLLAVFAACTHPQRSPSAMWGSDPTLEQLAAALKVPAGLDGARTSYAKEVLRAHEILTDFARQHGWSREAGVRTFDSVEIFTEQRSLWRRVLEVNQLPAETPLQVSGLAAALEGRILMAITPEEYARVQPTYAALPDSWSRLLAHEMVHRLHVELLGGNESAMGPQWFFEGFAVLGAGQNLDEGLVFRSAEEALEAAHDSKSRQAYRRFVATVRYFSTRVPLAELVRRASDADFESWLKIQVPR
jgi:hypothetical protein